MTEFIVVLITAAGEEEAASMAKNLVEDRLAACVNIVGNVRSIYRWQGSVENGNEALMLVKTRRELFGRLTERVKGLHSYSVPEIVALPVQEGSGDYLAWISSETG